jgi:hypothetical protein
MNEIEKFAIVERVVILDIWEGIDVLNEWDKQADMSYWTNLKELSKHIL